MSAAPELDDEAPPDPGTARSMCAGRDDPVVPRSGSRVRQGATIWIAAAALMCWLIPNSGAVLELQPLTSGQAWRLLTGHLVHFDFAHFALDTAVLLMLGLACERRDPQRTLRTFALAGLGVSLGVLMLEPGIEHYRGLSGIDSALFALLAALVWQRRAEHDHRTLLFALLPTVLFLAKVAYEATGTGAIFLPGDNTPHPLPVAHLIGALCGLFVGLTGHASVRGARHEPSDRSRLSTHP